MSDSELTNSILDDALDRVFSDLSGAEARQSAEAMGWMPECWAALADTGLAWVGVPEAIGGSGGDLVDAYTLLRATGRYAAPLPLAECVLLGGWLLGEVGIALPSGPVTVPVPRPGDALTLDGTRLRGHLERVPWATQSAGVVALAKEGDQTRVVLINPALAAVVPGHNLAGEPRDELEFDDVELSADCIAAPDRNLTPELRLRGALSRALLMAGAMESVTSMTVKYADERHQFGRSIAGFQAVGHRIVRMASEAEMSVTATTVAAQRFAESGVDAAFEIAAAKAVAARSASEVAAHAHQIHGAIGMTQEYPLHQFTRRLWAWRQEWGSESHWATDLGYQVQEIGAERLWQRVATGLVSAS